MDIINKNTDELIPYVNNARTHTPEQVAQIAASIKEFGFCNPVLIDKDSGIIAGHGRVMAAQKLGLETVPTIELSHLTDTQRKAYILADNRLAEKSGWDDELLRLELGELQDLDFDLSLIGFDDFDLTIDEMPAALTDEDAVPEVPDVPVTKLGDVWLCDNHRLMCGDSTSIDAVDKLMNGNKADMVFTDPPYNVKISQLGSSTVFDKVTGKNKPATNGIGQLHGEFKMATGEMSQSEFTDFLRSVFICLITSSKDGSIHYVCMDWRHMSELLNAGECYTELKNLCVWNKDNGGMGSFYRSKHELVFVFKNGTESHTNNFMLGETGRHRTNVWDYPIVSSFKNTKEQREESKLHPTVKPLELVCDAVLDCSNKGDAILDLFGGSGSTLIACEKTNRINYSMELDEKYCDVIVNRWQNYTGKQATLESTGEFFNTIKEES